MKTIFSEAIEEKEKQREFSRRFGYNPPPAGGAVLPVVAPPAPPPTKQQRAWNRLNARYDVMQEALRAIGDGRGATMRLAIRLGWMGGDDVGFEELCRFVVDGTLARLQSVGKSCGGFE